ncbi:MAG: DNA adenine methylase [Christensenellaceae bacterium]|jgi:DNA adenine methylase|nr:DNA adenine methylase [Christensenellaceae bacterium]
MKPILKYPGAKWKLADWIIANLPPHESYLEPYFGSGAVFFNKTPARIETINDIDGAVVHFFKTCRNHPDELARAIEMTPWARDEFMAADPRGSTENDIERARQFAVKCWMSFGARLETSKSWRHSTGAKVNGGPDNPKLWNRVPGLVYEVAARLKEAQIENRPALDTIAAHNGPQVLIYADPPYLRSTRTLHGDQYRHEMTERDHRDFLDAMLAHTGMAVISGYGNDIYDDALSGWTVVRQNTVAERGVKRTESLWINPAAAEAIEEVKAL